MKKCLWFLLLLPMGASAMDNYENVDGDLNYVNHQNNNQDDDSSSNQNNDLDPQDENDETTNNNANNTESFSTRAQRWYDTGFNQTGVILNRMTGNGESPRSPRSTTTNQLISLASGFVLPFFFAATSKVRFRRLPNFAFRNVVRNMAVGTVLFAGATGINATAGAGLLGGSLGNGEMDDRTRLRIIGKSSLSFLDKEVALATFFIEQMVHPVFLSSCLGGGLWAPALMNIAHSSMTPSIDRNRMHRTGIMAGLVTGLLVRYRGKVFQGLKQEVGRLIFR